MCVIISLMLSIINLHIYFQLKVFEMQENIFKYTKIYTYTMIIYVYILTSIISVCIYLDELLKANKGAVKITILNNMLYLYTELFN